MTQFNWQAQDIRWYAVIASLALSLLATVFADLPNDDAYVYFRTAELFLADGFAAARDHYSWPFYAVLIATLSKLGFSLLTSAMLLNAVFFALITWVFITIVMQLAPSKPIAIFAAATILLYPELNEFRAMVIRDAGFWAFSLIAVWQLLRFQKQADFVSALLFIAALLIAALLRIEALVYLGLLPALLITLQLYQSSADSPQAHLTTSRTYLLALLVYGGGLAGTIVLQLAGVNIFSLIANVFSSYAPFIDSLFSNDPERAVQLQERLAASHGEIVGQFSALGPVFGSLAVLLSTLATGMSGAYCWLLVYGAVKRHWPALTAVQHTLLLWVAINAVIVVGFLVLTGFLSSRYVMLLCVLVATQIPLVVAGIRERHHGMPSEKRASYLLILFFTFCFFDAHVSFGRSKAYLQDAADYIAVHNVNQQPLLTNNHSVAWASSLVENYDEIDRVPNATDILSLPAGSYLALEIFPQMADVLTDAQLTDQLEFVTAFPTEAEPSVTIYRRR